jgi:transposase
MLGLGAATRIFVATGATDMRLGFNGLYALVVGKLQQNPQSGHLFLFANSRRDRMKILFVRRLNRRGVVNESFIQ